MATIKTFSKQNLPEVRKDLDAALAAVEKKHGIKLAVGSIRFDANSFSAKLQAHIPDADGTGAEVSAQELKWRKNFKVDAGYGLLGKLTADDLDKEFDLSGKKYRIAGAMSRSQRQPVIAQLIGGDNKYIRVDADVVHTKLNMGK